jgi:hypothetical protein
MLSVLCLVKIEKYIPQMTTYSFFGGDSIKKLGDKPD